MICDVFFWPRQISSDGESVDGTETAESHAAWLSTSDVSKLVIDAGPGAIVTGA